MRLMRSGPLHAGTLAAQGILLASMPFLTRIYGAEQFGIFATVVAASLVLGTIASGLYEGQIPIERSDREAARLVCLGTALSWISVFIVWVAWLFLSGAICTRIRSCNPTYGAVRLAWMVALPAALTSSLAVVESWQIRRQAYHRIGSGRVVQATLQATVSILLGLAGMNATGLLIGFIASRGVNVGWLLSGERHHFAGDQWSLKHLGRLALKHSKYPRLMMPAVGAGMGVEYLPTLVLAAFYGAPAAGYFSLAQRIVGAPIALIGRTTSQVLLGDTAKSLRDGNWAELNSRVWKTTRVLFVIALGLVPLLVVFGLTSFEIVFGSEWKEAGVYLALLAPALVAQLPGAPLGRMFVVAERLRLYLSLSVLRLLVGVGAILVVAVLGVEARGGVIAYSVAAAGSLLLFGWSAIAATRDIASSSPTGPRVQSLNGRDF